jgi:flavin-binding protein dodecin
MKNPTGKKLEKLVFGIFDQMVEGADKYVTKQGSTWLIFTESKKWVIEFTKDKTLWFNYNVFQNELDLIGKDCTEERDLIKNWFESRFLNKLKVWATFNHAIDSNQAVEDTIQNGVKEAHHVDVMKFFDKKMENTIENGVKDTKLNNRILDLKVEDTIQNGVKNTEWYSGNSYGEVEDTIENGVKETQMMGNNREIIVAENIYDEKKNTITHKTTVFDIVDDIVQNGVKETKENWSESKYQVEDAIENGVKDIIDPFWVDPVRIKDAIQNGVKETKENRLVRSIHVMSAILNGVKHVEDGDWLDQDERIDDIIESGVKEIMTSTFESMEQKDHWKTNDEITESINDAIKNGVKETKESMLESSEQIDHQVTNCEITENINDAIENGVKETKEISNISLMSEMFKVKAKQAIRDGVKETKEMKHDRNRYHGHFILKDDIPTYIPMAQVQDVIENGVKEIQPLPAQDGNRDWGLYYQRQGNLTKPHTEYVKEVIEDSYNHMGRVEGVIRNTDKDGI